MAGDVGRQWQIPEGEGDEVDQAADLRGQCGQPVGVQVQLGQVAQLPGQVQGRAV